MRRLLHCGSEVSASGGVGGEPLSDVSVAIGGGEFQRRFTPTVEDVQVRPAALDQRLHRR